MADPERNRTVNLCYFHFTKNSLSSRLFPKIPPNMLYATAFCQAIQDAVFGEKYEHFVALYSDLKKEIDVTIPDFRPFDGDVYGQNSHSCHLVRQNLMDWTTYGK